MTLAELRARTALRRAGLDPSVDLERASSVTNEVWLSPTHVIRVNRARDNRLAREAALAPALPREVGYPQIVAYGGGPGEDWLVVERVPGVPLAHRWPDLNRDERRHAVAQIAACLKALHVTDVPAGLPPIADAPQLLDPTAQDPTEPLIAALLSAARLTHVDPLIIEACTELVEQTAEASAPVTSTTLVHGDLTFENVLWDGDHVSAVLDLEWSRPGPPDLDLDIILRCCAYPQLHVAPELEARTHAEDYQGVPGWLAEEYPALFSAPAQLNRMRVYSLAFDVKELLAYPPEVPAADLSPLHPYHRLVRVVQRRSYLDELEWPDTDGVRTSPQQGPGSSP